MGPRCPAAFLYVAPDHEHQPSVGGTSYARIMAMADVSAADVLVTLAEYDQMGRQEFLERYGYREATRYFIDHNGNRYDSKAVVGVAHGVSNGRPLLPNEFSGGENTVVELLERHGFTVRRLRNPDWTRDEVILACDLVARNNWHGLPAGDQRVIELSSLLQQLDIHPHDERGPDFRNANGVARKTSDIATRHPDYRGKPTRGGQHDHSVLEEFLEDTSTMTQLTQAIRDVMANIGPRTDMSPDLDVEELSAAEGRVLERRHLTRERDPKLRARKIKAARKAVGRIACEACDFDFARTYGDRGLDFAECHHRVPLHASGPTLTRLEDLVLLCSNCHRMIHRYTPWLTFEQLCGLIASNRREPATTAL